MTDWSCNRIAKEQPKYNTKVCQNLKTSQLMPWPGVQSGRVDISLTRWSLTNFHVEVHLTHPGRPLAAKNRLNNQEWLCPRLMVTLFLFSVGRFKKKITIIDIFRVSWIYNCDHGNAHAHAQCSCSFLKPKAYKLWACFTCMPSSFVLSFGQMSSDFNKLTQGWFPFLPTYDLVESKWG